MAASLTELILERAHNAAISMDEQGRVTYWNASAERMFGIAREEALDCPVADLIVPPHLRAAHLEGLRRFLDTGIGPVLDQRIEIAAIRGDGSEFPVELTVSAVKDQGRRSFHAFVQDITERNDGERERERLVEELRRALRGSERRFEAIVGSLIDPVTIRDRDDSIVYANRAALVHLGFETWEQLRETPPAQIMAAYEVTAADGSALAMQDIPSVRILRGEDAEPLLLRTIHRQTRAQRWNLLKAAPVFDEQGEVEATITIIEDVTEQKRAELRSQFLAEASTVLASSLDYEQTLRNVAELAVPDIADWCAVDLLDADGDRRTVAVAHVDPGRIELAEALRTYTPDRPDPNQGMGLVMRTGEPLLYGEISDEMIEQAATDERHLELLRAVGFRSALVVAMRIGGRTLGVLTLVSAESARPLDEFDVELAEQIAARAAVAIENSRLYSERSGIARTLQQSLLPEELPQIPGYELASMYLPAQQSSMVGGDFYDVWEVEGSWMILIGDVTGKGAEAAALTALVRHTMRAASRFLKGPAELLTIADATLKGCAALSVCTAMCMRLDGEEATLAVGGHPLPLALATGRVRELGDHGPLLGAFPDAHWREVKLRIEPASTLLAYTDGFTDARDHDGERYGLARLCNALAALPERPAAEVIDGLRNKLNDFQTTEHADDTAALVLRRLPGGEHASALHRTTIAMPERGE